MSKTVSSYPGLAPALRLILLSSAALLITDRIEIIVENASEVNVLVQRMQDIDNALAELAPEGGVLHRQGFRLQHCLRRAQPG